MENSAESIERFTWPVSVSRIIKASPEQIWSAITKPGNLEDAHPFCKKNPVQEWSGVGYDLVIGRDGGRKSYVSWRLKEEQTDTSRLRITIYPHALQNIPVIIRWVPHIVSIQPALHIYLESVLKGFEWLITTGNPVSKNQFGSHKWFSTIDA